MGWNYAMGWLVILPFELTAAGLTIRFWNNDLNSAIFISVFWLAICLINLAGVRGYGEAEFLFSAIKVTAVIGFIILGIVIDAGGSPSGIHYGDTFWHDPGSFNNGFKGVCSVFVTAAFAFSGTELTGLAAAETVFPLFITLIQDQPSQDTPPGNKTSHLAYPHFLRGLTCHCRLPCPLR
jgi:amino acid transporter